MFGAWLFKCSETTPRKFWYFIPSVSLVYSYKHSVFTLDISRFPQEPSQLLKWLEALAIKKDFIWSRNKKVCSEHFKPSDFRIAGSKKLLKGEALPSVTVILDEEPRREQERAHTSEFEKPSLLPQSSTTLQQLSKSSNITQSSLSDISSASSVIDTERCLGNLKPLKRKLR